MRAWAAGFRRSASGVTFRLEHSASMFQLEHTGDLQLYVHGFRLELCAECSSWNIEKWRKLFGVRR